MLRSAIAVLALGFAAISSAFSATAITPTTTLTAETANTTSAADSYNKTSNGNALPGNISQQNIHNLLYPGSTAKVYAHFMGWFGTNSHMDVGYDSATLAQVHKQISDMMNRGIDGMIIDWYGVGNSHINQASLYVKQDAETRGGNFSFAVMEDQGAVKSCAYQNGCDVTQKLIDDFNYIVATYASSPAYIRVDGQPLIFTFDVENLPNIDWNRVMASVQGNPKIVLRNDQGFRLWYTSGSYSWVSINKQNPDDWAQRYLDDFYATSRSYPAELVLAGTWKGFNDTLASWGQNRIMNQNCGQVWLSTFNEMNRYFSTQIQASAVQLVTWNDYEEGTEIETGIDNCVSVSGSVNGLTLYWSISGGQENTLDHYTVFISVDGENLMKVADIPAGTHQIDLGGYGFGPGNYTMYVKAVGQPSMLNKMSAAIPFSIVNLPPIAMLNVTPTSGTAPVTVTATTAGSYDPDGNIVSTTIDFGDGTILNTPSGSHTYSTPGMYTVTATVTDNYGAIGTATSAVTVYIPFTVTPIMPLTGQTVGQLVHFVAYASSQWPVTTMKIYVDNVAKYSVNASSIDTVLRLSIGSHYVVLQAWNTQGQIAKTPLNIKVINQLPVATVSVTPNRGVGRLTVTATASGTDQDGTVTGISIDFGDGTIVNTSPAIHTYVKSGQFTVTATVTDNDGGQGKATTTVTLSGAGTALVRPGRLSLDDPPGINAPALSQHRTLHMRSIANRADSPVQQNASVSAVPVLFPRISLPQYAIVQASDPKEADTKPDSDNTGE
ncbi:MAG: PKD domain-containing protein [Terriglobales bacterium]